MALPALFGTGGSTFSDQALSHPIDLGGLIVLGVLAFSGKMDCRSRSFTALYVLLVLVVLISFGPFVLMMAAPRSALMAGLMQSMMSSGALLI